MSASDYSWEWQSYPPTPEQVVYHQWWFHKGSNTLYVFNLDTEGGKVYDHTDNIEPPELVASDWPGEWAPCLTPSQVYFDVFRRGFTALQEAMGVIGELGHALQERRDVDRLTGKISDMELERSSLQAERDCALNLLAELRAEHEVLKDNFATVMLRNGTLTAKLDFAEMRLRTMAEVLVDTFVRKVFGESIDLAGVPASQIRQDLLSVFMACDTKDNK